MKSKVLVMIVFVVMFCMLVISAAQAAPVKKDKVPTFCNTFLGGILCGVFYEFPVSSFQNGKNACNNKDWWDCIFFPKSIAKGGLNGLERAVGTTFAPGYYEREPLVNGPFARNKLLTNIIGGALVGFGYGAASGVTNTLFGTEGSVRIVGWAATGGIFGAGLGGVETAIDNGEIIEEK